MKKKLFMLLALAITTLTASAEAGYDLKVGTSEHGTITFKVGDNDNAQYADEGDVVTVTITPATGWVVNQPSGQWYAAIAASRGQAPSIDLLNAVELTAVEGQDNQWTFTMKRANVEFSATYKKVMQDAWVQDIAAQTYTGQALEPTVTVQDGSTVLVENTDYTVTYSNNANACEATAAENAPTVTITATGDNYSGTITKTFTIQKADITATAPTAIAGLLYTGQPQALIVAGSIEGAGDMQACQMQYSLDGEQWSADVPQATEIDEYTVHYKVVGDANHNGVDEQTLTVKILADKAALASTLDAAKAYRNTIKDAPEHASVAADLTDAINAAQAVYDVEMALQPDVNTAQETLAAALQLAKDKVAFTEYKAEQQGVAADMELSDDSEYCQDLVATAISNIGALNYDEVLLLAGNKQLVDDIIQKLTSDLSSRRADEALGAQGLGFYMAVSTPYTGQPIPLVTCETWVPGVEVLYLNGNTFTPNVPTGIDAGNYTVTCAAVVNGAQVGYVELVSVIRKKGIESSFISDIPDQEYTGTAIEPELTVTYNGMTLVKDVDYTVKFENNVEVGTATVTVFGAGDSNYGGRDFKTFNIVSTTTGIEELKNAKSGNGTYYDMNGRRVLNPTKKGVYIRNGRKVVVK